MKARAITLPGVLAIVLLSHSAIDATAAPPPAERAGIGPAGPARAAESNPLRITPVVKAYRKSRPAVVNISTERLIQTRWGLFGFGDDPFEEFFPKRTMRTASLGSGFLIHPAGYIITNAHVVRRAQKITATLSDKSTHAAEVVAANDAHDLAVLRIKDAKGRKFGFLRLGRSDDLMIGETVIAIGNPFGYQNTCSTGVISALGRKLEFRGGSVYRGLIQIDAPINPGNSGGPLLNIAGELIGINTAIRADAQGIGFAIPVDMLEADIPKLLDFERLNRVIFGLTVRQRRTDRGGNLVVAAVAADTPAARAGCKVGDRLLTLNGKNLVQLPDYQIEMLSARPGSKVKLRVLRGGRKIDLEVAVTIRPKPDGAALAQRLFGMKLRQLTPELARRLGLAVNAGLIVDGVEANAPAARLGIRSGDVVFQLGRWYVTDLERVGLILEDVGPGEVLRVGIVRGRVRAWGSIEARKIEVRPPAEKGKVRV